MQLLPVLQALGNQHEYIEILRGHPLVPASQLHKYETILCDIEATLEEMVKTPLPRSASEIKYCMAGVIKNIALTERNIAAHEGEELGQLTDSLRLRMAETCLAALRFELRLLTDALPDAIPDTDWIN